MTVRRLAGLTQSNGIRLNSTAYGNHLVGRLIPILQAMIDPTAAEVTVDRMYDTVNGYPGFTGTGTCFDNNPMTKVGSFYQFADGDYFIQPTDPADTEWPNFLAWPKSTRQNTIESWIAGLPAQAAQVGALYIFHSEYDTQAPAQNGWIRNDPRVLERAWRRRLAAIRAALGKTAEETPVLVCGPILFSSGADAGFELARECFERLVYDRALNCHWALEACLDFEWDGDTPGTYGAHASAADCEAICRRMAYGFAQVLGPRWAPNAWAAGRYYPYVGPRIGWAQRTSDTNIRCTIAHEGGSDFTLPTDPLISWACFYAGAGLNINTSVADAANVPITAVTKVDYRTIDVTLGAACPIAEGLRIAYGWGNRRQRTNGGIYDDRTTVAWTNRVIPPEVTGANRVDGALARTPARGLVVSNDPPPLWAVGPPLV